jgi:hypothetical protein
MDNGPWSPIDDAVIGEFNRSISRMLRAVVLLVAALAAIIIIWVIAW